MTPVPAPILAPFISEMAIICKQRPEDVHMYLTKVALLSRRCREGITESFSQFIRLPDTDKYVGVLIGGGCREQDYRL